MEHNRVFGPFPLSYQEIVDDMRLQAIMAIVERSSEDEEKLKPFHLVGPEEISEEDQQFVMRIMKLDP